MTAPAILDPMTFTGCTVAGRTFVVSESTTFKQDIAAMALVDRAKLDDLFASVRANHPTLEQFCQDLMIHLYANGTVFRALSLMLTEEGVDWTEDRARATEGFFADLTEQADKEALAPAIAKVLLTFFANGVGTGKISLTSFSDEPEESAESVVTPDPHPLPVPPSAASGTSGHGTTSSGSLPDTTPDASPPS